LIRIAILTFPGAQSLDVTGPMDVFAEANRFLPPADRYQMQVVGTEPGPLACSNGMLIQPHAVYDALDDTFELLIVAGGPELPRRPRDTRLCAWLRDMAVRSARVASICNGAFLLAHAGLLDGRHATTHWNDVSGLTARFPKVLVQPDRIYVRDGHIYTSAGVTAGIDLALHLVFEDWGADVSLNVAKRLVVFTQRSGGQSQFSPYLTPHVSEESPLQAIQQYVLSHLQEELSVQQLASLAAMSSRNFARVFARELRLTPAEFVERARVDAARVLLETSQQPLKSIAHRVGFGNPARLRAAFLKHLNISALQYRQHFGAFSAGNVDES
jgi:transcriptional regulator GlxA family with amidase domain